MSYLKQKFRNIKKLQMCVFSKQFYQMIVIERLKRIHKLLDKSNDDVGNVVERNIVEQNSNRNKEIVRSVQSKLEWRDCF